MCKYWDLNWFYYLHTSQLHMWQSCPAESHTASYVFLGGTPPLFWLFFCFFLLWMDFKLSISLFHLDLTYNPTHHPKYIHRMSISGIYNCWTYQWKHTKLSQYSPWRDPLHWCFNTHTKSYMHTSSPSLHAVPHLQGAKVREHRLMLNDLLHTHCSTFGTVFVATLDDFLL